MLRLLPQVGYVFCIAWLVTPKTQDKLLLRKDETQFQVLSPIPYFDSFRRSLRWGTLSNALEKSKIIISVCTSLSSFLKLTVFHWLLVCDPVVPVLVFSSGGFSSHGFVHEFLHFLGYPCGPPASAPSNDIHTSHDAKVYGSWYLYSFLTSTMLK